MKLDERADGYGCGYPNRLHSCLEATNVLSVKVGQFGQGLNRSKAAGNAIAAGFFCCDADAGF